MKKIISFMLLLLFPIMMLTGCGKPGSLKLSLSVPTGIELQVDNEVVKNNQKINNWKTGKEVEIYVYGSVSLLNFKLFVNGEEVEVNESSDFQNGLVAENEKQLYGTVSIPSVKKNLKISVVSNFRTLTVSTGNIASVTAVEKNDKFGNNYYFGIATTSLNLKANFKNLEDNKNLHLNIAGGNITLYDTLAGALAGAPTPSYNNGERYHEISTGNGQINIKVIYTDKGSSNLAVESANEIVSVEIQMIFYTDTTIEIYQN